MENTSKRVWYIVNKTLFDDYLEAVETAKQINKKVTCILSNGKTVIF